MALLELAGVHAYYGQSHVLNDISLLVEKGEVVTLLGRNGAGKTTTLRSVIGLVPPRGGQITFDGKQIDGKEPFEIARSGIGYVPEDRRVFPDLSVVDNLKTIRPRDSSWDIGRIFELFPLLEEKSQIHGSQLSGGQQQMLAIARALICDPDLLLLDEPSEGLAPVIVDDLEDILSDILKTGTTVLLAEQNTEFAFSLAERGYIISRGTVKWEGTIDELHQNEEIIDKYLGVAEVE
jgi:branched-chain amino acid transport system ATP-binding protein